MIIDEISEYLCSDEHEVYQLIDIGNKNRAVGCNRMNQKSSRSHTIMTISVIMTNINDGQVKQGKLHLVDLAGSERTSKTGAQGKKLAEATSINQSLTTLGRLINAFNDPYAQHFPYRESKLTRILADSLGGNSKTCMIVTVSQHPQNKHETLSTLRYGSRAQKIKNNPHVNRGHGIKDMTVFKKLPATPRTPKYNQGSASPPRDISETIMAQKALQIAEQRIQSLEATVMELRSMICELEGQNEVDQNQIRELRQMIIDLENQLQEY